MRITDGDLLQKTKDNLRILATDVPDQVAPSVSLVYGIHDRFTRFWKATNKTNTGSTTAHSFETGNNARTFFVTYLDMDIVVDAASDGNSYIVQMTLDGALTTVAAIYFPPSVAGSYHKTIVFPFPLKIDKAGAVRVILSFTAGTETSTTTFGGYYR